ncbi:hypothetical protein [Nocardioides acrostichi]|uniref:Uncharacterized protein n=1 Tax=Nocardioides acrostichi TaxID=2784339 RepID=A0A930UWK1_9ACTN|nr:hypothetical protein [Nocardioides acrostichi]MBF4160390.1 hypothetical protein [Nocardioides acrostichi]
MLATLDPDADEVYDVALVPRRRTGLTRVLVTALDLWCAASGGLMELTRVGSVVVRERVSGLEVLRLDVPTAEAAALTLESLRDDLAAMEPAEFRAAWHLAP